MSEKLKTIKELADELGVSKNKIHYQVSKISSEYVVRNNSMKLLTAEAVKQIKENLGIELNSSLNSKLNTVKHQEKTNIKANTSVECVELNSALNSYLNSLKHQIEYLESQNINKDEQIKSLVEAQKQTQNLLDQQQRLSLQDKKLLEEYKAENDSLKALKMPSQDTKEKQSSNQSLEKEKDFVQTIQESYESEIKVLNQKLAEQEEQLQEIQKEKETKEKKWFQFWK